MWPYGEPYPLPLLGFIIINKLNFGWVLWCAFSYSLNFSFFCVSLSSFFFWKYLSDSLDFPMETDFVDCSRILLTMLLVWSVVWHLDSEKVWKLTFGNTLCYTFLFICFSNHMQLRRINVRLPAGQKWQVWLDST